MSLRRAKTLYCVTMIAVSVLLAAWGGVLGCAAGALLLAGALPLFKVIGQTHSGNMLTAFEYRARARLSKRHEEKQPVSDHFDTPPETPQ